MRSELLPQTSGSIRHSLSLHPKSRTCRIHSNLSMHILRKGKVFSSHRKFITMTIRINGKAMICRSDMEDGKMTQKSVLLEHLKRYGSIEPLTALREYGIYRLGARIADLRSDGYNIVTQTVTSTSRITGRPVHFANYILRS